jgi:hypothetical protein
MAPTFSSTREAGAFGLTLLLFLALPIFAGKWLLPSREKMYSSTGNATVDFPFYHQQIFDEKQDIDIAFMGSSRMGCAIDPEYVQKKLSEKLGRPAVVRLITWSWQSYDALYIIAGDLLEHRKVHMLVFNDLNPDATNFAHHQASLWFRYGDNSEALSGLPLVSQGSLYASAILGLPRNLVGLLRDNLPAYPKEKSGYGVPAVPYVPETPTTPSDVIAYSPATKNSFHFDGGPMPAYQKALLRKIGVMADAHQSKLVYLHLPVFDERRDTRIDETEFFPDLMGKNVAMVGIPPSVLFAGMSDADIDNLFIKQPHGSSSVHLNFNGRNFLTTLITPELVQIYEDEVKR